VLVTALGVTILLAALAALVVPILRERRDDD